MLYKTDYTTYVVKKIPVSLWKKCKSIFLLCNTGESTMGDVIIKLLREWVKENKDGNWTESKKNA
jgi:hypothetical protein